MPFNPAGQHGHLIGELRQRCRIALCQFANAASQRLRNSVEFALHAGCQPRHPLVVHYKRLDIGFGQLGVLVEGQLVERGLGILDLLFQRRDLGAQIQPRLEQL